MSSNRIGSILAVFLAALPSAWADSWPDATVKAVASESGEIVVRITPGTSIGDTYGFAGSPKGKFASAQWFRYRDNRYELYQTAAMPNPVAPIQVAVANDGTMVTLDNWHNVGMGDIVVIYGPDGKLQNKYGLRDLYPVATIEKIERSVSSIWWRCMRSEPRIDRRNVLQIDDTLGGRFTFQLASGKQSYEAGAGAAECRRP
jgi:hypothetical protein